MKTAKKTTKKVTEKKAVKKITKNTPGKSVISKKLTTFRLEDTPGKKVFVAGNFNDWQFTNEMTDTKGNGIYTCRIYLAPGEYQYKFVVDGEWKIDCNNPSSVSNGLGELNSVLKIEAE